MPPQTALIEISPPSLQAARMAHLRLAHNALAVALLKSRNVPLPSRAPSQVPHTSRVSAVGGQEWRVIEALKVRIEQTQSRAALAPNPIARAYWHAQLDRMEAHREKLEDDLKELNTNPIRPGLRNTYRVSVPALSAHIRGSLYVAAGTELTIEADPGTPNYERYLGRGEHAGHGGTGQFPLWRPGDTNMRASPNAEDWHFVLIAQLWGVQTLPELQAVFSQPSNAGTTTPEA